MNYLMIKRLQIILVVTLLSMSAACLYGAKLLFVDPGSLQQKAQRQLDLRMYDACVQAADNIGFDRMTDDRNTIGLTLTGLSSPMVTLGKASLLIHECAGYQLQYFCMGQACDDDVEITLGKTRR